MLNRAWLCMMKADVLDSFDEVQVCTEYEVAVSALATCRICWRRDSSSRSSNPALAGREPANPERARSYRRVCSIT